MQRPTCLAALVPAVKPVQVPRPPQAGAVCAESEKPPLSAEAESSDKLTVAVDVLLAQVAQLTATLADQLEQPAPRVVVVLMLPEVLGEVLNALSKESYLHLGRAGVARVARKLGDDLRFSFFGKQPSASVFLRPIVFSG